MAAADISIGARFTRWTVLSLPFKNPAHKFVSCRCECGTEKPVRVSKLRDGTSKSCGCWQRDNLTTHGMTATAVRKDSHEYWIWNMVVQRCRNPRVKNWMDYGGRGITVCDSWLKFENFYADMGRGLGVDTRLSAVITTAGITRITAAGRLGWSRARTSGTTGCSPRSVKRSILLNGRASTVFSTPRFSTA